MNKITRVFCIKEIHKMFTGEKCNSNTVWQCVWYKNCRSFSARL